MLTPSAPTTRDLLKKFAAKKAKEGQTIQAALPAITQMKEKG